MILDHFLGDIKAQPRSALALLGREIGIENFRDLFGTDPMSGIGDAHVDVEIFANAIDLNCPLAVGRGLDCVDDNVLNRARNPPIEVYLPRLRQKVLSRLGRARWDQPK